MGYSFREAWLNHTGTIIAVVWKQDLNAEKSEIANKIFTGHQQPFLELTGSEYEAQLVDFENGNWYKGTEVDQLSMIEAGRIAGQIMNSLDGKLNVPPQMEETLRNAFEEYIKEEFLKIEDADVIYQLGYWKRWERDLTAIDREYLGEAMPEIQIVSSSGECKLDNSNGKSSCCKKGS
jgi:hypothetical protein